MTAYLLAESGVATPLYKGTVRVGRDAFAELAFTEDLCLSPFHYEIVSSGDGHAIYKLDAGSRLLVNDKLINDAQLQDGDVITAGATTLIYCSQVPDPPASAMQPEIKAPASRVSKEDRRASRVLASFTATAATVFAYSFVCNFSWVFLAIGTYLTGYIAGRLVRTLGDDEDRLLGLLAAAAALGGVLIVHMLTHHGVLHMYEVISLPGTTSIEQLLQPGGEAEKEEKVTQIGTGETAAEVAQLTFSDVWQRFMPVRQTTSDRFQVIQLTGFTSIFLGSKSLLAYVIITLAAWHRGGRRRIKIAPLDATPP